MTIPFDTYDPNWKARHDAINSVLEAVDWRPHSPAKRKLYDQLVEELHDAFHAQFRTTGDFAAWTENNVRRMAKNENVADSEIPVFPRNGSVEDTRDLQRKVLQRLANAHYIEKSQAAVEHPAPGQPFAYELLPNETRSVGTLTYETAVHSYILETRQSQINVCFLQVGDHKTPSPLGSIEDITTQLYNEKFGPGVLTQGGRYRPPHEMNFYIYFPPRETADEQVMRAGLKWDTSNGAFVTDMWEFLEKTPYVIRKLAAVEGLAKDPDAPHAPGSPHLKDPKLPSAEHE